MLRDDVKRAALELDTLKPEWPTLIPTDNKDIDMHLTCGGLCILGRVFKVEAKASIYSGYGWAMGMEGNPKIIGDFGR